MLDLHGNGCSVAVSAECVRVEVVLECPETSPPGPKTMVLLASLEQSELSCTFEIEVFVQPWAAGWWEERRKLQVSPWDVESIYCPSLRVRNQRDIGLKFLVQTGCEQVHLGTLPKFGNLFEYLWRQGPLC